MNKKHIIYWLLAIGNAWASGCWFETAHVPLGCSAAVTAVICAGAGFVNYIEGK